MSAATSPLRLPHLNIGTKIGLIVGLMLVPFGLMTWLYLAQVQKDVSFSASEQLGTRALGPIWSLLAQAARPDAGPATLAEKARDVQAQASDDERDFKAGDAVNTLLGAVSANKPAADVLETAKAAITKIGDGSNLTLDPDVDSYYLMDAVTVRLPEAAAALADLRSAAAPALHEGQPGSRVLVETVRARTRFAAAIANAEGSLSSAIGGSPDGSVGRALDAALKRLTAAGDALIAHADAIIAKVGDGQDDAADKEALAQADTAALAEIASTWTQARAELDRLLANRVDGFKSGATTRLSFTVLCLLLVAFVTVMVVRSVRGPLADLMATIRRFQSGDYGFEVPHAEARNEIGEIARALKRFQELGAQQSLTMNALDGSSTLLMITDPEEKIVFMSGALTRLFMELEPAFRAARHDFSVEKMFGQHIDYYSTNPELKYEPLLDDGHVRKARLSIAGKVIDLDMSYIRSTEGARIGHTMLWRDITAELRAEHEVGQVVAAAAEGDFSKRLTVDAKMGFIAQVAAGLNAVSDQVEQALGDLGTLVAGLAEGDLTRIVKRGYKGRFGQLFTDLNAAVERLAETVDDMQRTAAEVEDAAHRINAGADNLAQRTEEQAASLEQTAATTEELAASVRQSAEASRRAVELAAEAAQVAANGGSIVRDAVEAMSRIEQGSQKISDITSVIDEIAFQTNLLALNAAVEAARAGDAGKGFAVVASEVRTLAQRSSEAAKDITALIGASHDEVSAGVRLVKEAGDVLGRILEANGGVSSIINDVSTATAEQANGIHEVSHAVAHMDEITQQNASLADESAAGAADLSNQVAALNRLVSAFETGRRSVQAQSHAAARPRQPVAAAAGRAPAPRPAPSAAAKPAPRPAAAKPTLKPAIKSASPAAKPAMARAPMPAATTSEPDRLRKLAAEAFAVAKPTAKPAPSAAGWEEF